MLCKGKYFPKACQSSASSFAECSGFEFPGALSDKAPTKQHRLDTERLIEHPFDQRPRSKVGLLPLNAQTPTRAPPLTAPTSPAHE